MSDKKMKSPMPLPVTRAIAQFGRNLALARRRRHFSQESMAERIGVSVASLRRLEKGDPTIAWGTIARAMLVLGELGKLGSMLDAGQDDIGLLLQEENLPKRIRKPNKSPDAGAL